MFTAYRVSGFSLCLAAALFAPSSFSLTSSNGCTFSSSSSSSSAPVVVSPLSCSVTVTGQWNGGYQIDLKIKNSGAVATDKWQVVLNVPTGDSLSSAWNGQLSSQQGNAYTYDNLSWNNLLQPGGSASVGAIINNNGSDHGVPTCQIITAYQNNAPVADFSTQTNGPSVQVQTINASDADGDPLTYSIDFGDGKTLNAVGGWHTYKTPGTYTITQKVSDSKSYTSRTHTVTVVAAGSQHAPVAAFSYTAYRTQATLDASGSADIDGNELTYQWDLGQGPLAANDHKTEAATITTAGAWITLTVFDGSLGDTVQAFVPYSHCSYKYPMPVPEITAVIVGNEITVAASGSQFATNYFWDFGDGIGAFGMFASHTYTAPGTYTLKLSANNQAYGVDKSQVIEIKVPEANKLPVACFDLSGTGSLSVNAACSSDADGDSLSYSWAFGDGASATGITATHSYAAAGNYPVTLTVADGKAQSTLSKNFVATATTSSTRCNFKINNQWATGFNGSFVIKNEGTTPVSNWQALLTFPVNETVASKFNGTFLGANPLTVKPPVWATTLQPGASQEVGFLIWKTDPSLPTQGPALSGPSCQ